MGPEGTRVQRGAPAELLSIAYAAIGLRCEEEGAPRPDRRRRGRRRLVCGAAPPARRVGVDHDLRARPARLVRQLRPALLRRRRDHGRGRAARRVARALPHPLRRGRRDARPRRSRSTAPCARCACTTCAAATTRDEPYDVLVLAPGAAAVRPPLPGVDLPGVFAVRSIPDTQRIRAHIEERAARRAVVVGGGFIGLEMAENLLHRGLAVADPREAAAGDAAARSGDGRSGAGASRGEGRRAASRRRPRAHRGRRRRQPQRRVGSRAAPRGRSRDPRDRRASRDRSRAGRGPHARPARRHRRRRADADQRSGHLGGRRRRRGARRRRPEPETIVPLAGPANRQGRIAAESICGRAAPLPRRAGDRRRRRVRADGGLPPARARRACGAPASATSRRSTCTRAITPATTPARSRST